MLALVLNINRLSFSPPFIRPSLGIFWPLPDRLMLHIVCGLLNEHRLWCQAPGRSAVVQYRVPEGSHNLFYIITTGFDTASGLPLQPEHPDPLTILSVFSSFFCCYKILKHLPITRRLLLVWRTRTFWIGWGCKLNFTSACYYFFLSHKLIQVRRAAILFAVFIKHWLSSPQLFTPGTEVTCLSERAVAVKQNRDWMIMAISTLY